MPQSLQLDDLGSKRREVVDKLSQLATDLELSYTITGDEMTIRLPQHDEVELPIVGTIQVPLEEDDNNA